MLQMLFVKVLNMSLTGTAVIVAVLLLRLLLRRAPKIVSYSLWAVVLFRLLCPISFSLPVSLLGVVHAPAPDRAAVEYVSEDLLFPLQQEVDLPVQGEKPDIGEAKVVDTSLSDERQDGLSAAWILGILWGLGMLAMLVYGVISVLVLRLRLRGAREEDAEDTAAAGKGRIYLLQGLPTAFVFGLLRPRIYLPEGLAQQERKYVVLHEQIHIRRGDHILQMAGYLALCLHWFNPLVWVAFFCSGRDMEMACDEAVIRKMGGEVKGEYSRSLLSVATGENSFGRLPLAFGEGDTESRIRNVLRYKKPTAVAAGLAVAAGILAAVFLLANPASEGHPADEQDAAAVSDSIPEAAAEPSTKWAEGQDAQQPSSDSAGDMEGAEPQPDESDGQDILEGLPEDITDPAEQRVFYQQMDRRQELTVNRLKELLEASEPLLEMYAGYQNSTWRDDEKEKVGYLSCNLQEYETGVDLRLLVTYRLEDNWVERIMIDRRNDSVGGSLYFGLEQHRKSYTYERALELIDLLTRQGGEVFRWMKYCALPGYDNIHIDIGMNEFRTESGMGEGEWKGIYYTWRYKQPEWTGSADWGPPEWRCPASIIRIPAAHLRFENGELQEVDLPYQHAERTTENMRLDEYCQEQALMWQINADMYTITEIDEAAEAGEPIPEEYQTADFWYVCFGRENSPWAYLVVMNGGVFSQENAIWFVRDMVIREEAWGD